MGKKTQNAEGAQVEKISLGDEARDAITGYTGVVIAVTNWLYGCRRLTLQARELKDGKPVDNCTFDEPQCVLINPKIAFSTTGPGGPMPTPAAKSAPNQR